ncbi:MAG: hypothetical protein ACRDKT_12540 [Actinomycetota bacterium]
MKCPSCGATVAEDARWCPQCYTRFDETPVEDVEGRGTENPFAHPEAYRRPPPATWSRWKASATAFGPVGRVLASLALLLPFYFFFTAGVLGLVGMAMWLFVVMPMALRSIWKRTRIVPPDE